MTARPHHPDLTIEILSPRTAAVDGTTADLRRRFRRAGLPLMIDVRTGRWITPRRVLEQLQQLAWSVGAEVRFLSDEQPLEAVGGLW